MGRQVCPGKCAASLANKTKLTINNNKTTTTTWRRRNRRDDKQNLL